MSIRAIIEGDKRRLTYTLTDVDTGLLVDASTIAVQVRRFEDGVVTNYTLASPEFLRASLGTYHFHTDTLTPGTYEIEFQSDGTYPDRKRTEIRVVAQI